MNRPAQGSPRRSRPRSIQLDIQALDQGRPGLAGLAHDRRRGVRGERGRVVTDIAKTLLQGRIADEINKGGGTSGLQISFIVPMIAYAYVAFYGLIGHKIGRGRQQVSA